MRIAFAALLALHGLIHLLGLAKAFDANAAPALALPVSKPAGLLWLTAAALWVTAATLLVVRSDLWSTAGVLALVLSQVLILGAWRDARAGTVVNAIVAGPVLIALLMQAPWSLGARYERGTVPTDHEHQPAIVTEADLAALPAPVQSYLAYTGAVGRPRVANYRARFKGDIREDAGSAWMTSAADQFSVVSPASRWFLMRATRAGVPFEALHIYEGTHATFQVRLAGLKAIIDAKGPEMDQSETVTLFNDLCLLAPAALIDSTIGWQQTGDHAVRATFTHAGHTIRADLVFDANGALRTFSSEDRYRLEHDAFVLRRWTTPVTGYRTFDGRRIASEAEARWTTGDDEFAYARFVLVDLQYNVWTRQN